MARDRSIALRVRADVHDAVRGLDEVGRAAGQVGDRAEETGRKSQSLTRRVAQSAREQRQEWTTVGTALTTYGAAVTGLGALVLNTGINYNSLRQTATQALTAVTGSTEDAAYQMQRLDQYGQNSWLMRDTLIQAQQTMTGFGIETSKVIPYMDALAEATAATGGNNQDFLEMAQIMGQIQSQGRITARELERFGMRGVDAASLIGDAMGLTASQIRDEISTGAFDAQTALDALAQGMADRYGGASDLVRQTWRGAVDDVMAAFRDLSAAIASPLVDPEGGGILVGLANQVADTMRAFEGLPTPILTVTGLLAGLTGPAALAAGGFLLLAPRIVDTWDALGRLGTVGATAQTTLRNVVPYLGRIGAAGAAIGITATAVGALMDALTQPAVVRETDELAGHLGRVADAGRRLEDVRLADVLDQWPELAEVSKIQAEDLGDAIERILDPSITDRMAGFFGALLPVTSYMEDYQTTIQGVDDALMEMISAGNAEAAAALIEGLGVSAEEAAELFPQAAGALEDFGNTSGIAYAEMYQGWMDNQAAINEAREALEEYRAAQREVAEGFMDLGAAFEDGWNIQSVTEHILEQVQALTNYRENLQTLDERVSTLGIDRGPLFDFIEDLDPVLAAEFVAELAVAEDVDLYALADALGLANDEADNFADTLAEIKANEEGIDLPVSLDTDEARTGFEELVDGIEGTSPNTELHLDPTPAIDVFDAETGRWYNTRTRTFIDADESLGMNVFNEMTDTWQRTTTETLLDLDPDAAVEVFDRTTGTWVRTTTETLLSLDPGLADRTFGSTTSRWANVTTNTNLGVNDYPARSGVNGLLRWIRGQSASVTVYHRSAAQGGTEIARATGGPVFGPGTETSDSIPARLSHNEHVWSAAEVRGAGGHAVMEQMRAWARAGVRGFAEGGTPAYQYRPVAPVQVQMQPGSGGPIQQTVNNYGLPADRSDEWASATLFAMRRGARGSLHERGVAHA